MSVYARDMCINAHYDMDRWSFIRTAHHLAKLGTISATAKDLGVHRATVLRHVDALEEELGVKLFQRHARGYIPTEAGEDLMRVASATEDQFLQLFNRLGQRSEPLSGEFIVTSLAPMVSFLLPVLKAFQELHPAIQLRYLVSETLYRLEYGEAHVAVRAGPKPDLPDNVVVPLGAFQVSLYAHADYIAQHGHPARPEQLVGHKFISFAELRPKVPVHKWILNHVREKDIALKTNEALAINEALLGAVGIGFMFRHEAEKHSQLVELFPPLKEWEVQHWLVTHGDLHRSAKVQAFLEVVRGWFGQGNRPMETPQV